MRKVIAHFIFLFILIQGKAQEPLRLADAVNIALKNSLDVQLASNDLEANTILNTYGMAGGMPLVTAAVADNEQISTINQKLNTLWLTPGTSYKIVDF